MKKYVALLLGVNVGGNRKVPMKELKALFEELGFEHVKTLLNSGNVVFDAPTKDQKNLKEKIEKALKSTFGFEVVIILLPIKDLQQLVEKDPFKNIQVTPNTRLYITFLSDKPTTDLELPYKSADGGFKILRVEDSMVISVLEISEKNKTPDAMKILQKEFGSSRNDAGKKITTRNWNTLKKIVTL